MISVVTQYLHNFHIALKDFLTRTIDPNGKCKVLITYKYRICNVTLHEHVL